MKLKQKIKRLLIWSQKYTQTDMVYLAKGGFWLTLGKIVAGLASFLLAIALANLLDPVTYGNYRYLLSLIGILTVFSLTGIETAVAQATARGLEGSFYKGFKTKLKWGTLGSLVAVGGAIYYFLRGNFTLPIPLLISAVFLPLMEASRVYGAFLGGRKLFNFRVKYSSLSYVISAGAIIGALFLTKNLFWLIAVYLVSHTLSNYFFYLITKFKFKPNKKEDSQTIRFGKHLSLAGVIGKIANEIDRVLVFHYLGAVKVAIYSFAVILPEQIRSAIATLYPLALPKFAQKQKEEIKKLFLKR